ncbi:hypothetical protein RJ639_007774 [Escallonia herrerae]|uniref:Zinc finger A20 and AN1 domain-containing stress-associated protein 8 n=1 Tax=Escallonia herrerae TaxID=1293975 RepID=A0AA88VWQ9_9ASTE|nr:hypothetical protein RJ639_007774 [Escallonia herrerae]
MEQNETGCQAPPDAPILCVNNCGFFGTATTMNMCSKCHKDLMLKQEHAKLAASSIESIVNGSSSVGAKESDVAAAVDVWPGSSGTGVLSKPSSCVSVVGENTEKNNGGSNRCSTCKKRVGLTGFNCRCGNLFCSVHRYSEKHGCTFDYRSTAQDAIARANPVVKAQKIDKI